MTIKKITKFWRISKVLETIPDSVEVMIEQGLHCYSCKANTEERLYEGMEVHGFTDQQIDEVVDAINDIYAKQQQEANKLQEPIEADFCLEQQIQDGQQVYKIAGVILTQKAFEAIHDLREGKPCLTIKVEAGGCNGYSYKYQYANQTHDHIFTLSPDIDICMDTFTFNKVKDSTVDFEAGLNGSGLVFNNPNAKNECHCGVSVGF
jgi:iron-sulfur cluster assembly protein